MSGGTGVVPTTTTELTTTDYERLRQAARTYREEIVVRLCGEVGLRPPEISRLTPADFQERATPNGTHHLVTVADGSDETEAAREAYVPSPVRSAVRRYVNERDVGASERLVAVTPRRIQMIVAEVADRAAETVGDADFRDVSSRDLCRYYARRLVDDEGVDPRVVLAIGPWEGLDSLAQHLDPVDTDGVLAALERTAVSGPGPGWQPEALGRAIADADLGVVVVDEETVRYANEGFARLTGFDADDVAGRDVSSIYAGGDAVPPSDADGHSRVRLRHRDGRPIAAEQIVTPTASDAGGALAVFVEEDEGDRLATAPVRASSGVSAGIEVLHQVTRVLSTASNRTEVVSSVCERVAAHDAYGFAWVGSVTHDGTVVSSAWNGIDESTAEGLAEATDADVDLSEAAPIATEAVRVADGGQESTLQSVATGSADHGTPASALAYVPLAYGETTHGVLAVGKAAESGFADEERQLLASLGSQVGQALTDIERKNLLLADSVLELQFQTQSEASFFVTASTELDASFSLQGLVPGESQSLLYFVMVRDTTPEEVVSLAADADTIESARLIRDYGESYLVEFVVGGDEPATTLTEFGGQVTEFDVEDGRKTITADFTTETDVRAVFNGFQSRFPESDLTSKQEVERPVQTTEGFQRSLENDLTSKQQSVLRAAYLAGYFEWPRGSTAEELADSIGVSSPTLHNHLRKAQQKVLTAFFEDVEE